MRYPFQLLSCTLVVLMFVSSCSAAGETSVGEIGDRVTEEVAATGGDSEVCVWEDAQPAQREWNRVAGVLVADYLDLSVSAEAYVQASRALLPDLEEILYELQGIRDCMSPIDEPYMRRIVSTKGKKLTALQAIETAVLIGSVEMEEDALALLDAANAETFELACEVSELAEKSIPGVSC